MRESGNTIKLMVRAPFTIQTMTPMKAPGSTTKPMATESTKTSKALATKVNGKMINSTAMVSKSGPKAPNSKVNT